MKTFPLITIAALLGPCLAAQAFEATYWGETQGNGDGNPPITSWTAADTASADFQNHLVGVGTETFEGFANGQSVPLNITFPGAGTATLTGNGAIVQDPGSVSVGRFNTTPGGNKFLETSQNFTINFSAPVAAFGFYATDVGDFGGTLTLTLSDGTTTTVTVPAISAQPPGGSVEFFGYINTDDPFTKVTFGDTEPGVDFFGFDDMTIGSIEQVNPNGNAPDGGSTLMMLVGALGCMSYVLKKKQARC
jgi:hypothetical protein